MRKTESWTPALSPTMPALKVLKADMVVSGEGEGGWGGREWCVVITAADAQFLFSEVGGGEGGVVFCL